MRDKKLNEEIKCACGCNQELLIYNKYGKKRRFIKGHSNIGMIYSKERVRKGIETRKKNNSYIGFKKNLDLEKIKELYLNENSIIDISKMFHCSFKAIYNRLEKQGIKIRTQSEAMILKFKKGQKIWNKKIFIERQIKEIIRLYEEELLNPIEIGKRFNCSNSTILKILKENYISTNQSFRRKRLFKEGKLKSNGETLKKRFFSGKIKSWSKGLTKETDERIMRLAEKRANQIFPIKDSSIEIKLQNFLKQLQIEFFTHQYMHIEHGYQCDIFIPVQEGINQKIVIECDGNYWHGNPKYYPKEKLNQKQKEQRQRDRLRTQELIEKGFKVIRIWEHDIRKMDLQDFQEKLR